MIAFISYSHKDRQYARQTRQVLTNVDVSAFLAHEHLEIAEEWKDRILEELKTCQLFIPLLSEDFRRSKWAPQEAGFIASRPEVRIARLSIDGTIPFGFMEHVQSGHIGQDGVTHELLVLPLARQEPRLFLPGLIRMAVSAGSFRSAEEKISPLVELFEFFTAEDAQALAEGAAQNRQVWSAWRCREVYLPKFIQVKGDQIRSDTLKGLQYQIKHDEAYAATP